MAKRGRRLKLIKRLRIPKTDHEEYLKSQGFKKIAGLDEVGRGSWAGPIVAGAVMLPSGPQTQNLKVKTKKLYGLRDSKLLTPKEREKISRKIKRTCRWGIGEVSVEEINNLKLTRATQLAFERALRSLKANYDFILVDGFKFDSPTPLRTIKKGDMMYSSIAAASILAKVYRDRLMRKLDKKVRGYYFAKHKGYGTRLHQRRLKKLGPSRVHRKYYAPIVKIVAKLDED